MQKQDQKIKTLQKQDDKLKEQNYKLEQQKLKFQTKYTTLQEKYNNLYQGVQVDLSTYDGLKYQNTNTFSEYYNNQLNLYLTQITAKCSHNSFEIGNIYQQLQFDETVAQSFPFTFIYNIQFKTMDNSRFRY
ncbi:hypothetical protein PPERSA_04951 [Pseudocohnilembus persalinus]|uniref:Uncharacterized protein n=1 Tax=Pseudocohnilembus persalinus TaxID=266149 RepID=A0A0V0QVT9_PSEPJ|nr:hypothetical protein PPERSA_04951 [Pseudocohnilembus persalinus]|eukprot:KRX06338.1 hypothetical protein PPERSA_04951 [Pseudocohnilembus persalinus]